MLGGEDFADAVNGLRLSSHDTVDDQRGKSLHINLKDHAHGVGYKWNTEKRSQ